MDGQKQLFSGDYGKKEFKEAFQFKGLRFFGGPRFEISTSGIDFDVCIICDDMERELEVTELWSSTSGKLVKLITIPWRNFGDTNLTREQWQIIINEFPKQGLIAASCLGGTGRTGTALAILRALLLGDTESDPVSIIRLLYKKDAVESREQVEYVERITGANSDQAGSYECFGFYPYDDVYGGYGWGGLDYYDTTIPVAKATTSGSGTVVAPEKDKDDAQYEERERFSTAK